MTTRDDTYYQAVLARDSRFDGKFFIGVKTTGIYCRPICPAKPKRENVEFFADALRAEKAGYRPCLRCRPEAAPRSPAWMGKSATVQRALKLIAANVLLEQSEEDFAAQLGMSARHLRRLFEDELGKTPKQISDQGRLNFARKLITETALSVTDVAYTSGFASIRRFNDAFKDRFKRNPSELRRGSQVDGSTLQLSLPYRPPFDWKTILAFFHSHQIEGVENVDEQSYGRVFELDGVIGALKVSQNAQTNSLQLRISTAETKSLFKIVQKTRQIFDLDSDPLLIANAFAPCITLSKLNEKYPGLRLPRGWDAFETSITAILGQLVSVEQGKRLVRQLVENYGKKVENPLTGEVGFLFPSASLLSGSNLSKLGTTLARKHTIREFSKMIVSKKLSLETTQDPNAFREKLLLVKGIGPWTVEYISLRAIGDTDAFPASDLILKRALELEPKIKIDAVKPWRAYSAIYLWKEYAQSLSKKPLSKKRERPNETLL